MITISKVYQTSYQINEQRILFLLIKKSKLSDIYLRKVLPLYVKEQSGIRLSARPNRKSRRNMMSSFLSGLTILWNWTMENERVIESLNEEATRPLSPRR